MILNFKRIPQISIILLQKVIFFSRRRQQIGHFLGVGIMKVFQEKILAPSENKIAKYWNTDYSLLEHIQRADELFEKKKYLEVYETLNQIKFGNEIEVVWRLARVLYMLSNQSNIPRDTKIQMIDEAYNALNMAREIGNGRANYHKWMAIILDAKNGMQNLKTRIRNYPIVRDHLTIACEKNPRDFTAQYMLGRLCYELASLTWLQRKIAKYMFEEPPRSTYQEAYKHLNRAEELKPRCCIQNMCVLAKVCVKLGQYYRAKYYLNLALSVRATQDCERRCLAQARTLIKKLEKYDWGRDLLYDSFIFTFDD